MRGLGSGCQVPVGDCCGGCDFRTDDEKRADYEEEEREAMKDEVGPLPRPETPGPWFPSLVGDYGCEIQADDGGRVGDARYDNDGRAIAALPERIAREDRARWWCEEALRYSPIEEVGDLARAILAILDGEDGT